ncbi:unnamed protein product [Rhizoctonia solani]|uniref:Tet-like 2OG-Fe(II) oxygenase domain-containing protein n=1 Tax=Rhizoctonia solani TaxID=456999 RepID=A0A8H3DSQ9_9AGAM|nr:unnamed protein product [Rhizoctonia solani]CAE6534601.1 unnamed protein product [Rhizoctonia solani]
MARTKNWQKRCEELLQSAQKIKTKCVNIDAFEYLTLGVGQLVDIVHFEYATKAASQDVKNWPMYLGELQSILNNFNGLKNLEEERENALIALSHKLCELPDSDKELTVKLHQLVKDAIETYKATVEHLTIESQLEHKRAMRLSCRQKIKLTHLALTRKFIPPKPIKEMTQNEVTQHYQALQEIFPELKDFCTLDLNKLREHRSCAACCILEPTIPTFPYEAKSSKQSGFPDNAPGGSAIPFIPGLFPRGAISHKDVQHHTFQVIYHGTTCGIVQVPNTEVPEIGLFIHIPTLDELQAELAYGRLAKLLSDMAPFGYQANVNGAWKAAGCPGKLKSFGWHPMWFSDKPMGTYKDQTASMKEHVKEVQDIFNTVFLNLLASNAAQEALDYQVEKGLPSFGCTSIDILSHDPSPGSNFTLSFLGFANQAHVDKDAFRYVFSVYIFVDDKGHLVTDPKLIKDCMQDGHFLWPDLHLMIDTSRCNGVVIFYWRGTHERHCTMESYNLEGKKVTRYGTSVQVNRNLLRRTITYHILMEKWKESMAEWEFNGSQGPSPAQPVQPVDLTNS